MTILLLEVSNNEIIHPNLNKSLNIKTLCIRANLQNEDLVLLKDLVQLEQLDLRCNEDLDNGCFAKLISLKNLKNLNLAHTKATIDVVDNYRKHWHKDFKIFIDYDQTDYNSSEC